MKKLKSFKHLKQGDVIYHYEHGWENEFRFLMVCPDDDKVAYLQNFWGEPVVLHKHEIDDISSEWFEQCTRLQRARYRMYYYEDMARMFRNVYENELKK